LESQESRKREFFKRLKENPGNGDASDEREVSMEDLFELANWKSQDPHVPDGDWYKDFGTFKLCGKGRFESTFLISRQPPKGKRL
jgi:hypothetical protein